jgi:hypothetical protein
LYVTVSEDKPARGEVVLVDWLDNSVTELLGAVEEAVGCAVQGLQNTQRGATLKESRTALRRAHELVIRFADKYVTELAAHDSISRLVEMGVERGRAWQHWVKVVQSAIERCVTPLMIVESALLGCWDELSEQLARSSVSVQATNIGQQITMREDQLELAGKAG